MFEKEAEEYRKDLKSKFLLSEPQLDFACQGFKDGYNKANEWNYPSKGEYPKDEKNVLCVLGEFENNNLEVGYYRQKEDERERWRFSEYSTTDNSESDWGVSAWKEIVLPELKESE